MDFGIDRIIEMFEDRFGRRAGTGLLFIVALGAVALSLHAFFTYLVLPLVSFGTAAYQSFAIGTGAVMTAGVWTILKNLGGTVVAALLSMIATITSGLLLLKTTRDVKPLFKQLRGIEREVEIGLKVYTEAVAKAEAMGLDIKAIEAQVALEIRKPMKAPDVDPSIQSTPTAEHEK
jgi:hypothetical protein